MLLASPAFIYLNVQNTMAIHSPFNNLKKNAIYLKIKHLIPGVLFIFGSRPSSLVDRIHQHNAMH
jgi:hypothetical protein